MTTKSISQIIRPDGFAYRAREVQHGAYVVQNAYAGEFTFFGGSKQDRRELVEQIVSASKQPVVQQR